MMNFCTSLELYNHYRSRVRDRSTEWSHHHPRRESPLIGSAVLFVLEVAR